MKNKKEKCYEGLAILRIGNHVIKEIEKKMKKKKFNYEDYKELQNTYEKLIYDLCKEAFEKGKYDLSEKEFNEWLDEICCYDGGKK